MGYAHYEVVIGGQTIEAGYSVSDVCNQDGCTTEIDRGLAYLCGRSPGGDDGCGGYFCESHLSLSFVADVPQRCPKCYEGWETERLNEFAALLAAALEKTPEIKSAGEEDGHPRVFVELADGFEVVITLDTSFATKLVAAQSG